jgi:hypothetical protein
MPLRVTDFSGGEATAKNLEDLGFVVQVRANASTVAKIVTEESLGAWVIKCNPEVWDL